jgi:hypothetical protein
MTGKRSIETRLSDLEGSGGDVPDLTIERQLVDSDGNPVDGELTLREYSWNKARQAYEIETKEDPSDESE